MRWIGGALVLTAMLGAPALAQAIPPGMLAAANAGDANAQYNVGGLYYQRQDYAEACRWFRQAQAHGSQASDSMIQILGGMGHPCAPLSPSARQAAQQNRLPDLREMAINALVHARELQPDAQLTFVQVTANGTFGFILVSPQSRKVMQLSDGSPDAVISAMNTSTIDLPLPHGFMDIAAALQAAHSAGMQGVMEHATLMVYRGRDGKPFAGWLIAPQNRTGPWLIGALDGKPHAISDYLPQDHANDVALRAVATAAAPRTQPQRKFSCTTMADHLNPFSPCSRTGYEGQNARLQYSIEWQKHVQGQPSYY